MHALSPRRIRSPYFVSSDASRAEESHFFLDLLSNLFDEIGAQHQIIIPFVLVRFAIAQPLLERVRAFILVLRSRTGQVRRREISAGQRRLALLQPLNVLGQVEIGLVDAGLFHQFEVGIEYAKDVSTRISIPMTNVKQ